MWLVLFILSSALSIAISVGSKVMPDGKRKNNVLLCLGSCLFVVLCMMGLTTYRGTLESRKQAREQEQSLSKEIASLKNQNLMLDDQIGDCNARAEALTTKFRAPVNFTRGVSERLQTQDSIAIK
jgi:cell division protein FtsB